MEKQKKEILITGILIVIFFVFLGSTLAKRKSVKPAPAEAPKAESNQALPVFQKSEVFIPKQEELQWGRDPFALPGQEATAETGGQFILSAVIWDENKPLAVINGEVVSIGRKINGYTVKKINKENVVLAKDGEEQTVDLYK